MTPEQFALLLQHQHQVLAFTGHRPNKVAKYEQTIRVHMLASMMYMVPREVISGMAVGVDTWVAERALELGIPLIAAIPFKGQDNRWPSEAQRRYQGLLERAAKVVVVCEGDYHPSKMQARNEWITDHCDLLLGYWNGSLGGARNCLLYAERIGRERLVVDPTELDKLLGAW